MTAYFKNKIGYNWINILCKNCRSIDVTFIDLTKANKYICRCNKCNVKTIVNPYFVVKEKIIKSERK